MSNRNKRNTQQQDYTRLKRIVQRNAEQLRKALELEQQDG